MRLSEWSEQQVYAYGPQPWARQMIVNAIGELNTGEDPVVFTTFADATAEQPVATMATLAALTGGLLTATITTDPRRSVDARLAVVLVPWAAIRSSLRLEIAGDPEERLPVLVTVAGETIQARYQQRPALTEFYLEALRLANG
jgi:hypothetical protein